jgi:hypothetical protein
VDYCHSDRRAAQAEARTVRAHSAPVRSGKPPYAAGVRSAPSLFNSLLRHSQKRVAYAEALGVCCRGRRQRCVNARGPGGAARDRARQPTPVDSATPGFLGAADFSYIFIAKLIFVCCRLKVEGRQTQKAAQLAVEAGLCVK